MAEHDDQHALTARDVIDEQGYVDPSRVQWEARNGWRFATVNGHALELDGDADS
jgi:hypothetical protein